MDKTKGIPMPRIGSALGDGRFAGIVFDPATGQDVALVDLGLSDGDMTFAAAEKRAKALGAHQPTREEARVLWANLDSRAPATAGFWFWTGTPFAGNEAYAWCQFFDDGNQGYFRKDVELRARAVRRLPLQPFDHSGA